MSRPIPILIIQQDMLNRGTGTSTSTVGAAADHDNDEPAPAGTSRDSVEVGPGSNSESESESESDLSLSSDGFGPSPPFGSRPDALADREIGLITFYDLEDGQGDTSPSSLRIRGGQVEDLPLALDPRESLDRDHDEEVDADVDFEVLVTPPSSFGPASPQFQSPLMRSPTEIIHKVLCSTSAGSEDMTTLVRAAMTCRELRSFLYENPDQALWRDIHLQRYDDPRCSASGSAARATGANGATKAEPDWKKQVQQREFVSRMFRDWGEERYPEVPAHLDLIVSTLQSLYLDLPPLPEPAPKPESTPHSDMSTPIPILIDTDEDDTVEESEDPTPLNTSILEPILRSPLFHHIYHTLALRLTKPLLRPLRAQPGNPNRRAQHEVVNKDLMRLHVLLPPDFDSDDESHAITRGRLREMVYSAGNYGESNDWGPFKSDGKVDWGLVDAIGTVMMLNAKGVLAHGEVSWRHAVEPLSFGLEPVRGWGYGHLTRPDNLAEGEAWDWARVQGAWCGSYAFLDYTDWIALNEPRLIMLHRPSNQLDLTRYAEAIGDLMRLELEVYNPNQKPEASTSTFGLGNTSNGRRQVLEEGLPEITTSLPTSKLLPPIYFRGSSRQHQGDSEGHTYASAHAGAASFVRGVVQLTADEKPEVRWTLVIRYGGEDRWRLEGVQVGGRGSKRGFFGIWTDALKEQHSPCGPIWYWPSG